MSPQQKPIHLKFLFQRTILGLSTLMALAIFAISAPCLFQDSGTYLAFANDIVNLHGPTWSERSFGYAILLVISLYTKTHSLIGILLIQAAMSVAMTWFIFRICSFFSIHFAFIMSLLAIVSLIPYNYQPVIFHDQSQLFFLIFLTYSLFEFKEFPSYQTAFIFLLAYDLITCFRPTFALLLPIVLLNFFIVLRKDVNRFRYLKLITFMLTSILAIHLFSYAIYLHYIHQSEDKTLNITTTGVQTFYNVYRLSHQIPEAFSAGEGSLQFKQLLLSHFANSKNDFADFQKVKLQFDQQDYEKNFAKYKNQPNKIVDQILKNSSNVHYWFLVNLVRSQLGDREADRLFLKTSLEQYRYHPTLLFYIIKDGLYGYMFNSRPRIIQFYPTSWYKHSSEKLNKEKNRKYEFFANPPLDLLFHMHDFNSSLIWLEKTWSSFYPIFHTIVVTGSILGFSASLFFFLINMLIHRRIKISKESFYILNIGLIYLGYIFPMLMLVGSGFRYHMTGILLLFLMCGLTFLKLLTRIIPRCS